MTSKTCNLLFTLKNCTVHERETCKHHVRCPCIDGFIDSSIPQANHGILILGYTYTARVPTVLTPECIKSAPLLSYDPQDSHMSHGGMHSSPSP